MSAVETIEMLETLAKVPFYAIAGASKDRIVYVSSEEGTWDCVWSLEPGTGKRKRITSETIAGLAHPRTKSNDLYFAIDKAKGGEQHKIYWADAVAGGEKLIIDLEGTRVGGVASHDGVVAYSGATKDSSALYTFAGGSVEKRSDIPPTAFLIDASDMYLAGFGVLSGDPRAMELFFLHTGTGRLEVFTPKEGSVNKGPVLRGSKALFESNSMGSNRLYVHDIESGETALAPAAHNGLARFAPAEHFSFDWTEDGRVQCIAKKDGESKAFVDGMEVKTQPGTLDGMTLRGGKAYVSHSTFVQPYRVFEIDIASGKTRTVIDNQLPESLRGRFGRSRFVRFKSADGREIPALVADNPAVRRRRTVTYIHGGPWGEVLNAWGVLEASFVASGYNLVAPNFRGSTGYGEDFRTLDIGDPGGADFTDMVYAARWAKENVATELALVGYSYGGYSTLYGLGREPELWACGVAGAPIADWKEMRDLSDAAFRGFIDVLFAGKSELLAERSPITYVKNVKRPLCIITGQNDSRTPMRPVLRYAMELLDTGVKFELHGIPDMGHTIRTTKDIMNIVYPAVAFLQEVFPPEPLGGGSSGGVRGSSSGKGGTFSLVSRGWYLPPVPYQESAGSP